MRNQSWQNVMAVLPHCFDDNDRRVFGNVAKHLHAVFLRIDEAVLLVRIYGVTALHREAKTPDRVCNFLFDLLLCRPTDLVRSEAQIAARNQNHRM